MKPRNTFSQSRSGVELKWNISVISLSTLSLSPNSMQKVLDFEDFSSPKNIIYSLSYLLAWDIFCQMNSSCSEGFNLISSHSFFLAWNFRILLNQKVNIEMSRDIKWNLIPKFLCPQPQSNFKHFMNENLVWRFSETVQCTFLTKLETL